VDRAQRVRLAPRAHAIAVTGPARGEQRAVRASSLGEVRDRGERAPAAVIDEGARRAHHLAAGRLQALAEIVLFP
jgi:hypothetical protein